MIVNKSLSLSRQKRPFILSNDPTQAGPSLSALVAYHTCQDVIHRFTKNYIFLMRYDFSLQLQLKAGSTISKSELGENSQVTRQRATHNELGYQSI